MYPTLIQTTIYQKKLGNTDMDSNDYKSTLYHKILSVN